MAQIVDKHGAGAAQLGRRHATTSEGQKQVTEGFETSLNRLAKGASPAGDGTADAGPANHSSERHGQVQFAMVKMLGRSGGDEDATVKRGASSAQEDPLDRPKGPGREHHDEASPSTSGARTALSLDSGSTTSPATYLFSTSLPQTRVGDDAVIKPPASGSIENAGLPKLATAPTQTNTHVPRAETSELGNPTQTEADPTRATEAPSGRGTIAARTKGSEQPGTAHNILDAVPATGTAPTHSAEPAGAVEAVVRKPDQGESGPMVATPVETDSVPHRIESATDDHRAGDTAAAGQTAPRSSHGIQPSAADQSLGAGAVVLSQDSANSTAYPDARPRADNHNRAGEPQPQATARPGATLAGESAVHQLTETTSAKTAPQPSSPQLTGLPLGSETPRATVSGKSQAHVTVTVTDQQTHFPVVEQPASALLQSVAAADEEALGDGVVAKGSARVERVEGEARKSSLRAGATTAEPSIGRSQHAAQNVPAVGEQLLQVLRSELRKVSVGDFPRSVAAETAPSPYRPETQSVVRSLQISLAPADLGTVRVDISVRQSQLFVRLSAATEIAGAKLDRDMQSLAGQLQALGYDTVEIAVEKAPVRVGPDSLTSQSTSSTGSMNSDSEFTRHGTSSGGLSDPGGGDRPRRDLADPTAAGEAGAQPEQREADGRRNIIRDLTI